MDSSNFSPVIVLAHKRPQHFQKVIEGLKKNPEFEKTPLFIFIDKIKQNSSQENIQLQKYIIDFANQLRGFASINVFISENNLGVFNAVQWATKKVLEIYDSFIYLEEDIIPKEGFLAYMNEALRTYKDSNKVYAVNGYAFMEVKDIVKEYSPYFAYRFSPWGFGTWKKNWESTSWSISSIKWRKFSPIFWYKFNKASWGWGWTLFIYTFLPPLRKKIQPWDIIFCLNQYLNRNLSLWNQRSTVINSGMDGSGLHSDFYLEQDILPVGMKYSCFPEKIEVDFKLVNRVSGVISPLFRKKMLKTALQMLCRK